MSLPSLDSLRDEDSILPAVNAENMNVALDFIGPFEQNPHIAARCLRDAWRTTHPQLPIVIASLVRCFGTTEPGTSALRDYLSSDLLDVASNIALDGKLYDFELTMYTDEENTKAIDCCTGILQIIAMCTSALLVEFHGNEANRPLLRPIIVQFLQKLPKLVEVLWSHRNFIRDPYGDKIQSRMHHVFTITSGQEEKRLTIGWNMVDAARHVMELYKYYCRLENGSEVTWPPSTSTKFIHLIFYAFIYERQSQIEGKDANMIAVFRVFADLFMMSCGPTVQTNVIATAGAVIKNLISSDKSRGLVPPVAVQRRFKELLRSPSLSKDTPVLQQALIILKLLLKFCPDIHRSKDIAPIEGLENTTKQPSLIHSLLEAATLSSCTQELSDDELAPRIFQIFLIVNDLLTDLVIGEDYWAECITNFEELRILPLLTLLVDIETRREGNNNPTLQFGTVMQKTFLGRLMNMQPNKPKINPGEMRRIVHNEYRKSMRAFEHGPNPSPERAQHWRQMAIQFGMNVDSGGNLRDEAVTIKCCSWKYCICFAGKANHPLQICTRCKKVAYCNAKCQKKDWAEHKKSCKKPA